MELGSYLLYAENQFQFRPRQCKRAPIVQSSQSLRAHKVSSHIKHKHKCPYKFFEMQGATQRSEHFNSCVSGYIAIESDAPKERSKTMRVLLTDQSKNMNCLAMYQATPKDKRNRLQSMACKFKLIKTHLLAVCYSTCSLLTMPTSKLVSNLGNTNWTDLTNVKLITLICRS